MDLKKITTKQMVQMALIAALYAALTGVFMTISFTPMQLRVSEVMVFIAYFNPLAVVSLTIGCFIANLLFSPAAFLDCTFGTLATLLSVLAISYTSKVLRGSKKGIWVAAIWPVLFNAVIVGLMLYFAGFVAPSENGVIATILGAIVSVGVGEFIVVVIMGAPLTIFIMDRYKHIINKFIGI